MKFEEIDSVLRSFNDWMGENKGCCIDRDLSSSITNYMMTLQVDDINIITDYKPQILQWIEKMFSHAEEKEWYETYWSFDLHGTISIPDYRKSSKEITYYPYAKETLQLISETRTDIIMIVYSSSYPDELKVYMDTFKKDNINFKYINENPEVEDAKGSFGYYEKKFYFNVLLDDKCGFNPETDWEPLYRYFLETKYKPNKNWSMKYKEIYHKG